MLKVVDPSGILYVMKKYTQSKIMAVKLDAEQAMLQICKVGGAYFTDGSQCFYMAGPPNYFGTCPTVIKTRSRDIGMGENQSTDNQPS